MSRDGGTRLVGYLFKPQTPGPHPVIVMLHGRGGPYSSLGRGSYVAETLTMRHKMWGDYWAERGYLALHVDSFSTRGYPQGFPKFSYKDRPSEVNDQNVRPLDAYGALDFLRARRDVIPDRIGVQGWSNGGMTVLATMAPNPPGLANPTPTTGFRAALAQYPSCRFQARQHQYRPYSPLLVLVASEDREVSPTVCQQFAVEARARGADIELVIYHGAHHAYDDPGETMQGHEPNRVATRDTLLRAEAFFRRHLQQ